MRDCAAVPRAHAITKNGDIINSQILGALLKYILELIACCLREGQHQMLPVQLDCIFNANWLRA
jgi:hypothetical protein